MRQRSCTALSKTLISGSAARCTKASCAAPAPSSRSKRDAGLERSACHIRFAELMTSFRTVLWARSGAGRIGKLTCRPGPLTTPKQTVVSASRQTSVLARWFDLDGSREVPL
jgi:hypothetical protein